ncbi:TPA: hypothetical protein QDC20_000134 [Burkholderia aenigmatica]|uniref:hypothetical protein n=1 Tax=Burkholderia sp. AU45251 TaxID=3059204 RepID=UPI00265627CF|nr:hypothetical protein [Burkholderia sp. AU45251]HDR9483041.1 hypothetical protein [Burkholderia aenigmatica]MDN7515904.1 hypothetical protein [Burkholderia sp. AU45251]HDR9513989.1 hypothetical protein [Burkholderia aenigmatica]HDR9591379.1 hypothetical protein [Burkholderia aenigmatica]HDR9598471.1 hypothetical protein [Burkholderia aenigmatica]
MLQKSRFLALGVVGLTIFSSVTRAVEPASVRVTLSDGKNGSMSLTLTPSKVAAGPVEFTIANASHTMKHEFLILPWSGSDAALPYSAKTQQVAEDQLKGLQGVEDLSPRETVTARFSLKAGRYLVFCNEPGHYRAAMHTDLLVGIAN